MTGTWLINWERKWPARNEQHPGWTHEGTNNRAVIGRVSKGRVRPIANPEIHMRQSGRTTRAVEHYKALRDHGVPAVLVVGHTVEMRRVCAGISGPKTVVTVDHPGWDFELGEIKGFDHNTEYVWDHFACERVAEMINKRTLHEELTPAQRYSLNKLYAKYISLSKRFG